MEHLLPAPVLNDPMFLAKQTLKYQRALLEHFQREAQVFFPSAAPFFEPARQLLSSAIEALGGEGEIPYEHIF